MKELIDIRTDILTLCQRGSCDWTITASLDARDAREDVQDSRFLNRSRWLASTAMRRWAMLATRS